MSEREKFEAWRKSAGLQNMGASHSLYALHAWQAAKSESAAEIAALKAQKDGAYLERNRCVALIAQMAIALGLKAGKARTAIEGWSDDWHGCIYIDLPAGQVSWHYHDSQAFLFDALPAYEGKWDGHDTEEKYRRVGLPFESELRKQLEEARKDAERAAIQIANQSRELHNCKTDYEYLVMITEDKNALHQWLNMRASRVAAVLPDRLGATVAAIDAAKEQS